MAAFKKAVELGVDGLEFDLQMSKDKKLVIIHDEKIDRTTNGKSMVERFTMAELQALDAGGWFSPEFRGVKIPTMDDVLDEFQGSNLHFNIEIKSDVVIYPGIEQAVLKLVVERRLENRVAVSSFNHYRQPGDLP